ncbi:mechanosensitive ion channel protein MscS [Dokdonia pacifica]|uniref:Mechanosensitive ion channel n=1 Tax=Dokdonia pacifica TaxID=1627892 RepID=A0A239BJ39_9FLAO|nr:mechanosensitive ion channel domain-containing protein [Dokdonia pacifica]GGG29153.1 mechanosensitive ion channel protein MscS [Dokdonia pacifica]SNS07856.1 Mechanosensitive ion channel [Dokdonia pacifica]
MLQEDTVDKVKEVITQDVWGSVKEFLNWGFHFGSGKEKIHITIGTFLLIIFSFILVHRLLLISRRIVTKKLPEDDSNKFNSIFTFLKYLIYILVVIAVLSASGVDVTVFLTASAALFVGLGFALQTLFQDVLSGIFIILDQTLHIGDIIEFDDGKVGRVFDIKLRTTRALTRDDKVIVIPNHKFLTEKVYNWTQNHKTTRESVSVGVAYGSDTARVSQLLLKSLEGQEGVLKHPEPFVLFEDFGDSALQFSVYFFTSNSFADPRIKSDLRFKIDELFKENAISIPFPQREVHLYNKKE